MKKITYILMLCSFFGFSQDKDKALIQANDLIFEANEIVNEDFVSAEVEYRKAISKKPSNTKGTYNLGNAYYKSGLYDEAMSRHIQAAESATTKKEKHRAFHNIGNALMKQNLCKDAVEAYKNALRNDPKDEETRYNFALARECAEQQGQGEDDQSEDENKDENKEDENKDKEDQKDKGDENDDNKDQEGDDDQKENEGDDKEDDKGKPDEEKDGKDPKNQNKKQQQQPGKLSPQQVKNLLEAMNNQEKKVQEKINAKKAKGPKVRAEKDW
jgi:tetratricopeptide (TPR) repeat protein